MMTMLGGLTAARAQADNVRTQASRMKLKNFPAGFVLITARWTSLSGSWLSVFAAGRFRFPRGLHCGKRERRAEFLIDPGFERTERAEAFVKQRMVD